MIEKIISIAEKAGRIIIDVHQSGALDVSFKEDGSPITCADHASDKYIRSALQDQFRIPVITEESEVKIIASWLSKEILCSLNSIVVSSST